MAECEWRRGDDDAALSAYRLAFAAQDAFPNLRLDLELSFAWEIATRHLRQVYDEALARLATVSEDAMTLAWPMNRYLFFGALALISADLGDSQGAARWARNALSAAGERKAPFPRHPRLGLVSSVDDDVLSVLTQLAVE